MQCPRRPSAVKPTCRRRAQRILPILLFWRRGLELRSVASYQMEVRVGLGGNKPYLGGAWPVVDETWNSVDRYLGLHLARSDGALEAALGAIIEAGLPQISVSAQQGRLLTILAEMQGARNILEIGTLGGYSTICLARALRAGGRLITLEISPEHARVAQGSLSRAGLSDRVEIVVGRAVDTLERLVREAEHIFDFVFIDADKSSNPQYMSYALKLTRPGSVIVVDNVVRGGAIVDDSEQGADVKGIRSLFEMVSALPEVEAAAIQTVGEKGYDGFLLARVLGFPKDEVIGRP